MKILAIDFGERRIGLAISEAETDVAIPLTTVRRKSDRQALEAIGKVVDREHIELLLIGEPLNMDGSRGDMARRAISFASKLHSATGVNYEMVDETLTSKAAKERLIEAGVDVKRHRDRVDAVAAQLLLEQYLSDRNFGIPDD
jgi:putative Holliday junction resolvase